MNYNFIRKINFSWFFLALLCFVLVLPFSQALVSIFSGVVLFASLVEDKLSEKIKRFKQNKILLFIVLIFIVYVISYLIFYKPDSSAQDLQKAVFFLIIPVSFIIGKPLNAFQKRFLMYAFSLAIFIASLTALLNWFFKPDNGDFWLHRITLISHIRFSFQLILAFWFFIILFYYNLKKNDTKFIAIHILFAAFFVLFLFFQQSLTGLIAFASSAVFAILLLILNRKEHRLVNLSLFIIAVLIPLLYVAWVIRSFYSIEKIDHKTIEKTTALGNYYEHDFENPAVENGHYTYLYICHDEMRKEWNKVSVIKYDDLMENGYPLYSVLIRYLTSKGLRKDAEGIKKLTSEDIANVEKGIVNVVYAKKRYSLYPRIYQTVWEYYMYSKTGNPSNQSFSQRLEFSKAAISIIKKNFWTGVGAGNWKNAFKKAYIENNPKLEEKLYASSHNQYLNYMVKFGIFGFFVIMFFIIYPVIKTKRYNDPLFLIFLVFMFFANFADSNLETHMGSSFFIFFYCFFVTGEKDSYIMSSGY